jgi:epoxide hydrolase-like predicted phosphatase
MECMTIKAVIFDVGGVLQNFKKRAPAHVLAGNEFGIPRADIEAFMKKHEHKLATGKMNTAAWLHALEKQFKIEKRKWKLAYHIGKTSDTTVHHGMYALARKLKANGYTVGILSNVWGITVTYNRKAGRYKGFSPVILSCEIGHRKPAPQSYRHLLRKLSCTPQECVFIDDTPRCIEGAKKLGINALLFTNITQLKKDLKTYGVRV